MAGTNPVGTWTDPDNETQSGAAYKDNLDGVAAVAKRFADAFAPHEYYEGSPLALSMKVALDAGFLWAGETATEVAAQQSGTLVAPVSNPRIDLVYIDRTTGAVGVAGGTEAASPAAPALPAGKAPIALLAMTVGMTEITNQIVTDVRALGLTLVDTADLVDGAVGTAALAAGAVTEAKLADGAAVHVDDNGDSPATFPALRIKVVQIGDWNMDTTAGISVAHGLSVSKIRAVSAFIRDDTPTGYYQVPGYTIQNAVTETSDVYINTINSTNIQLARKTGGTFDSTSFNSTSYNRGYLVITYDENG